MEEAKEKILVEFGGLDSTEFEELGKDRVFDDFRVRSGIKRAADLKSLFGESADLEVVPYENFRKMGLRGGRLPKIKDMKTLLRYVRKYNEAGIPFNIPLNGGGELTGDEVVRVARSVCDGVRGSLYELQKIGVLNGVQNYVTILRDELLDVVKELFPDLKTVASCIKFSEPDQEKASVLFEEAFRKYDYVVALPQQAKYDFLKRFESNAGQLIVFPHLPCAEKDLGKCKAHYRFLEGIKGPVDIEIAESFCGDEFDPLVLRAEEDLIPLIRMGVRGFKFHRYPGWSPSINGDLVEDLISLILEEGVS